MIKREVSGKLQEVQKMFEAGFFYWNGDGSPRVGGFLTRGIPWESCGDGCNGREQQSRCTGKFQKGKRYEKMWDTVAVFFFDFCFIFLSEVF